MVGCHNGLDGHESEQALGVGNEQGDLACFNPWGCKELDITERLNRTDESEQHLSEYLRIILNNQSIYPNHLLKVFSS